MGIRDLSPFLRQRNLLYIGSSKESLKDHVLGIDISILMYQYKYVARKDWISDYYLINNISKGCNDVFDFDIPIENNDITQKWISKIITKLKSFESLGCIPVIIFDGEDNENKLVCNKRDNLRKERKDLLTQNKCSNKEYIKVFSSNVCFTKEEVDTFKENLKKEDFLILQAETEADFLCSDLYRKGIIDSVFSKDTDMLTHGCGILITSIDNQNIKYYVLEDILNALNFTMQQFIDFCILCGCDYNSRVPLLGPAKAFKLISNKKSIDNIDIENNDHLENLKVDLCRDIFKYNKY